MKWGKSTAKAPAAWTKTYPESSFQVIHPGNFREFVVKAERYKKALTMPFSITPSMPALARNHLMQCLSFHFFYLGFLWTSIPVKTVRPPKSSCLFSFFIAQCFYANIGTDSRRFLGPVMVKGLKRQLLVCQQDSRSTLSTVIQPPAPENTTPSAP